MIRYFQQRKYKRVDKSDNFGHFNSLIKLLALLEDTRYKKNLELYSTLTLAGLW